MTRRKLVSGAFGELLFLSGILISANPAKAQKQLDPDLGANMDAFNDAVRALDVKVPNGLCPVCGTQADPIKANISTSTSACKPIGGSIVECELHKVARADISRCRKCSAAFYQDAE